MAKPRKHRILADVEKYSKILIENPLVKENKYLRIYISLMFLARDRFIDCYLEQHHVLPKSMGGPDTRINLVDLTGREHFIAHKCLTRFTVGDAKKKAWCAVHRMTFCGRYSEIKSIDYENARKEHAKAVSAANLRDIERPERSRTAALKQWSGEIGEQRRKSQGETMSRYLTSLDENDPLFERLRNQSRYANYKALSRREKMVEFYGVYYFGFKSLFHHTGCYQSHYEKYYLNGINPMFRCGRDGPLRHSEISMLVEIIRSKNDDLSHSSEKEVLEFMVENDIISKYAMDAFLKRTKK